MALLGEEQTSVNTWPEREEEEEDKDKFIFPVITSFKTTSFIPVEISPERTQLIKRNNLEEYIKFMALCTFWLDKNGWPQWWWQWKVNISCFYLTLQLSRSVCQFSPQTTSHFLLDQDNNPLLYLGFTIQHWNSVWHMYHLVYINLVARLLIKLSLTNF